MKWLLIIIAAFAISVGNANAQSAAFGPVGKANSVVSQNTLPNFTLNGGLPKWQACRAKIVAGTGNCTVLVICESSCIWGAGWQTNDYGSSRPVAWPSQLAEILSLAPYNIPASANSVMGSGIVSSPTTAEYTAMDQRATIGASWGFSGTLSSVLYTPGGYWWYQPSSTTGVWAFDCSNTTQFPTAAACNTDTMVYFWNRYGSNDVTTISVNGGAALSTLTDSASPIAITPTTISTTLAHNVWDIKCPTIGSSVGCGWIGFYIYNSAVSQAIILNAGWAGSTVVQWNTNNSNVTDPIPAIEAIAPTMCIIMVDGNDAVAGTSIPTFTTDKQNLITACKASGDVLLVTSQPAPTASVSYATFETYVAADVSLAATNNIPILNFFQTLCNYSGGSCLALGSPINSNIGWSPQNFTNSSAADPHMGPPLHTWLATQVAQILAQ